MFALKGSIWAEPINDFSMQARLALERVLGQGVGTPYTSNGEMKSIDEVSIKIRALEYFTQLVLKGTTGAKPMNDLCKQDEP